MTRDHWILLGLVAIAIALGSFAENTRVYKNCLELYSDKTQFMASELCKEITK